MNYRIPLAVVLALLAHDTAGAADKDTPPADADRQAASEGPTPPPERAAAKTQHKVEIDGRRCVTPRRQAG